MGRGLPLLLLLLVSIACKSNVSNRENAEGEKTPLDLFYGMEDWYERKESFQDSVLDKIPGLRHQEYITDLCIPEESMRCRNSLGIYIDEEYPSKAVRERVFASLDSLTCQYLSYNIDEDRLAHDLSSIETTDDFLNIWKVFYDNVGSVNSGNSHFPEVIGTRVCVVAHKVYENNGYATYLMECSYDYHGTCGCPSEADYITYDIKTGNPLSIEEVLKLYPVSNLKRKIWDAYVRAAKEKGFDPSENMNEEKLLKDADGAAIINEGLLIYFKPYNIGCGAEGQYNLVVK